MKKPTCTFPAFQYKIIRKGKDVKIGDLLNYRNPSSIPFQRERADSWVEITNNVGFKESIPKSLIVIRKNPIQIVNGHATWQHQEGDKYLAAGKDRNGKRFRHENSRWVWIAGINVWNGNKYLVRDGKRYKIQSVAN